MDIHSSIFFRISILLFSIFTLYNPAFSQEKAEWIRTSALSPDGNHIAFTYKGDLYRVPTEGGEAVRLTFHSAHEVRPVWSRDGQRITFASNRFGNFDVFVMDAAGGEATRLTFHSNDEEPYTFDASGEHVIFKGQRQDLVTHRQHPSSRMTELYQVPVTGGRITQIMTTPAEDVQFNRDGSRIVYQDYKGTEDPLRKHHNSSITRDIWLYDVATGTHTLLGPHEGEDRNPVFNADETALYYLSEEGGTFNVFEMEIGNPENRRQLTQFETHPVRFLSTGGGKLAFSYHGALYTMVPGEEPMEVPVMIRTQDAQNPEELVAINGGVTEMIVSPDGKEIAFVARGEVFVTSVDGSLTKRITRTPETEADVRFTPDGNKLIYSSERGGKWGIYTSEKIRTEELFFFASTLLKETALIQNEKDNYLPEISPDGKSLAFIEDRRTLKVLDLESRNSLTLLTPKELFTMREGDKYYRWSPDSRWLLMTFDKYLHNSDIVLVDATGKEGMKPLIQSGYYDDQPKWVNNGEMMIWASNRNGLRSYATSAATESDIYALFFSQKAWDEFRLSEEDYQLQQAIKEASKPKKDEEKKEKNDKKSGEDKKPEVTPLSIDWAGLEDRTSRLTIHSSRLGDAVLNKKADKVYYLTRFEEGYHLWETDLRTKETKMAIKLGVSGGRLQWDPKMENLYLLAGGRISKLDPEKGSQKAVKIESEMTLNKPEEFKALFEHVWHRASKLFYEPTYHGIDWVMMGEAYRPKTAHIGNDAEFADLIGEMLGELNVSHSGARYRGNDPNGDQTASLGFFADLSYEGEGWKLEEILRGGPLDKAGFDLEPGMIIHKVDGEVVSPDRDPAMYLNRKADKFTLLEITDSNDKRVKEITVKPISLGVENSLLYERFVRKNEEEVERLSEGKLGYVHIPGMGDGPYRTVFEHMQGKYSEKEGMVIDVRFNGGGDLVADLMMYFSGEPFLTYTTADKVVGGEPTSRWTKPVITLLNEAAYSDGHCYAVGYTSLDIGTSVGMPVPGTCSYASWERLPNGVTWGVVPVSAKNNQNEWLENNQTYPDIQVRNMPGIIDFGRDEQVEAAVQQLLKELKK